MEAAEGEEVDEEADIAPTTFDDIESLPPPPPPPSEQAQEFYAFDEPPVLIRYVSPKYPDLARQAGIEGTVLLSVLVGEDGKVISARACPPVGRDARHGEERDTGGQAVPLQTGEAADGSGQGDHDGADQVQAARRLRYRNHSNRR